MYNSQNKFKSFSWYNYGAMAPESINQIFLSNSDHSPLFLFGRGVATTSLLTETEALGNEQTYPNKII